MAEKSKSVPRMTGLFAGIFSSASGTWVPMPQLRRFTSVGAWALFFGLVVYEVFWLVEESGVINRIGGSVSSLLWLLAKTVGFLAATALVSFWLFLWIGGKKYGVESVDHNECEKRAAEKGNGAMTTPREP